VLFVGALVPWGIVAVSNIAQIVFVQLRWR
jgi:hypothetical protein